MQPLQRRPGVGAEGVADVLAVAFVTGQGGRGSSHGGLAAQQCFQERLVAGARSHNGLQERQRLGVLTERAQRLPQHLASPLGLAPGGGAELCERPPVRRTHVGEGDRESGAGLVACCDRVAGGQRRPRGLGAGPHREVVDLHVAEPVAVPAAHHQCRVGGRAGARHQHLEGLGRARRLVLGPHLVEQPGVADGTGSGQRQEGEQVVRALPRDRRALPADPVEEPQAGGHVHGGRAHQRWTAPWRSAARVTAASRAAPVSASVNVRSGARKRSANASDFLPSPTWAPV